MSRYCVIGAGAAGISALEQLRKAGYEVGGEQLKRVPKPYDAEHPRGALLKHKQLISWIDHAPAAWLHTAKAKAEVVKAWKALAPLNDWLAAHT